jgi:hypothetical protein
VDPGMGFEGGVWTRWCPVDGVCSYIEGANLKQTKRIFAIKLAVIVFGVALLILPAKHESLSYFEYASYFSGLYLFFAAIAYLFYRMKWF